MIKSDEEKIKSEENIKSDGEKLKSDEEKLKSDEEKLKSDGEKLKSDGIKFAAAIPVKSIIFWVIGIIVTVLIIVWFAVWFYRRETQKEEVIYTPDIILMGDSIFATTRGEGSVADILAAKMGVTVCDESLGGTGLCYADTDARLDKADDAYCMASITQALMTGDFRYQDSSYPQYGATWYFKQRIYELERMDFSGKKVLIIEHLLNDYQVGVPVNCGTDKYNEYTYEGALRSVITQFQEEYPELRIILVAPTKSWYGENNDEPSDEKDFGGGVVTDYIECQKNIAEETGVEWISMYDLYDDAPGERSEYMIDGIHPNEAGNELIAEYLYEYLNTSQ